MQFHSLPKQLFLTRLPKRGRNTVLHYLVLKQIGKTNPDKKKSPEKPNRLFRQYKNYRMLIRLHSWKITDQATSLMQAQYACKPRDPE